MATGGVLGNGTKVGFATTSPVTWTRVGQLMNIDSFMSLVPADVDTTVYGTSNIMTSMPGMIDPPEMQFTCLSDHNPSTSASLETLRQYQSGSGHANAGSTLYWRVEVPTDRGQTSSLFRAWEFQAFVKDLANSVPIGDKQTTQFTLRFAGGYWVTTAVVTSTIS